MVSDGYREHDTLGKRSLCGATEAVFRRGK